MATKVRKVRVRKNKLAPRKTSGAAKAPKVKFGKNYRTSQIYSQGMEFAFMTRLKGIYEQACTFVYCKDFLHDAVWAMVNQRPWAIHGFKYNPAKNLPLDLKNCVFAFRNTLDKAQPERFHSRREGCQDFLNQLEKQMDFESTQIYEVPHTGGPCWLIVGDKKWQHAPPLVGLYTLLIRVGCSHTPGANALETLEEVSKKSDDYCSSSAGSRDGGHLKRGWKGIQIILKHGIGVFHEKMEVNYPPKLGETPSFLHNHFGPVNFTEGAKGQVASRAKKAMPYWYRKEIWDSE